MEPRLLLGQIRRDLMSAVSLGIDLRGVRDSDSLANSKKQSKSTMDILSRAAQSPRSIQRSVEHRVPKTKIVCTIGPNTNNKDTMIKMMECGMSVTRMNFSHGDHKVRLLYFSALDAIESEFVIFFAIHVDRARAAVLISVCPHQYNLTICFSSCWMHFSLGSL